MKKNDTQNQFSLIRKEVWKPTEKRITQRRRARKTNEREDGERDDLEDKNKDKEE